MYPEGYNRPNNGFNTLALAGILAGMAFLFIVAAVLIGIASQPKSHDKQTPNNTEALIADIKSAIDSADLAEIRAKSSLDPQGLEKFYSGEALRLEQESLNMMKADNYHEVSTLVSRTYEDIQVGSDGQNAKVKMTERWQSTTYRNDNNKLVDEDEAPKDVPQTVFLTKGPGGWIITTFVFPEKTFDVETVTAEIKSAINTADTAEVRARETLDPSALESVYSGEALRRIQEEIAQSRAENRHSENVLVSRTYENIKIDKSGLSAKVKMNERWQDSVYANDTGLLIGGNKEPHDTPQTVYLKKEAKGWVITALDFDN